MSTYCLDSADFMYTGDYPQRYREEELSRRLRYENFDLMRRLTTLEYERDMETKIKEEDKKEKVNNLISYYYARTIK